MTLFDSEFEEEDTEEEELSGSDDAEEKEEEDEHRFYTIEYKCEDCDYLWREKQKAHLSDDNSDDERWVIDESNISCPICGSSNISRI